MLFDLLTELKKAILARDAATQKEIFKTLNRAGMDAATITLLLKEV